MKFPQLSSKSGGEPRQSDDLQCGADDAQQACRGWYQKHTSRPQHRPGAVPRTEGREAFSPSADKLGGVGRILFSLAYLESGHPDDALKVVEYALTAVYENGVSTRLAHQRCPRARWRTLAGRVHLAAQALHKSHSTMPSAPPHRIPVLSGLQQEALALRLEAIRDRRSAQLLGIPVDRLRAELAIGVASLERGLPGHVSSPDGDLPTSNYQAAKHKTL